MGQYFLVVNLDKKQYLSPHPFADGAKLLDLGPGTMTALAVLTSQGAEDIGRVAGAWAGDRIVIAGDWGEARRFVPAADLRAFRKKEPGEAPNLNAVAAALYKDISFSVLEKIVQNEDIRLLLAPRLTAVLPSLSRLCTAREKRVVDRVLAKVKSKRGRRKAAAITRAAR